MVLVAVEAMPAGSKPPAAVGERISNGERHDFGAAAPFSTKASSLQGGAGGSAFTPKLVRAHRVGIDPVDRNQPPCIA